MPDSVATFIFENGKHLEQKKKTHLRSFIQNKITTFVHLNLLIQKVLSLIFGDLITI